MAKSKPQALLDLAVNGHRITGEKRRGRWTFACDSFPELAARFKGDANPSSVLDEFMRRVLATAVDVKNRVVMFSAEQTGE